MHPTERDFIATEYRRIDMMKQAEKERLILVAQNITSDQAPAHHRIVVGFGTWLENLGGRLKSHYPEAGDFEVQSSACS